MLFTNRSAHILIVASTLLALQARPASASPRYSRGDANASGEVDISDALHIARYLFLGFPRSLACEDAADVDDDGVIGLTDAIRIVTYLFVGGVPPEPPFPGCGLDLTPDALTCNAHPNPTCDDPTVPTIRQLTHPGEDPCDGEPASQFPNTLQPGADLRRVTIDAPGAVCNDGSPGVMYVRPARPDSPQADSWIIHLQGGSGCSGFLSCLDRWCGRGPASNNASRMSSAYCPPSMAGTGIFQQDPQNAFRDYNHVFLYYCSSDNWRGRNSRAILCNPENADQRYAVAFQGRTIFVAAVRLLMEGVVADTLGPDGRPPLPLASLADARRVILSGSSAGAAGLRHNGDWFASLFDPQFTEVRLLIDAGVRGAPELAPDPSLVLARDDQVLGAYERENPLYDAYLDASCVAHFRGTGQVWRCSDTSYVELNHLTTPYFTRRDLDDGVLYKGWDALGVPRAAYRLLNRDTLLALPDLIEAGVETAAIDWRPGIYAPNCSEHVGTTSDTLFHLSWLDDAAGVSHTYHDALLDWLRGEEVQIVDTEPSSRAQCIAPVENIRDALSSCADSFPDGPTIREGEELQRVTLHHADAICNDGSPAVMYVRPSVANSPDADRWVIFFQGGSGCEDYESCELRWCGLAQDASRMSSRVAPEAIAASGIFLRPTDPEGRGVVNAFADYNQVFLYYCSSDNWNGRASDSILTDPVDPSRRYSINFRGHSIVETALVSLLSGGLESDPSRARDAVTMPALVDADLVLLAGFSAGSGGVLHNGDWIASQLEPNGTAVRLVRGAGFLPSLDRHPDPGSFSMATTALELRSRRTRALVHDASVQNSFLDESAVDALEGTAQDWRLADNSYVTLNHLTTPFFLETDLLDRSGRNNYARLGIGSGDFAIMMRRTLLSLGTLPQSAVEGGSMSQAPGAMGTHCSDHFGFLDNEVFFERTVEDSLGVPRSIHDALRAWLGRDPVSIVDDLTTPTSECGVPTREQE